MSSLLTKKVLIIFTGGTVAGNVADSKVSQRVESDGNSFLEILEKSVDIIKTNRNIDVQTDVAEIL